PPQAVMMHLNGDLQLLSPAGEKIGDFYEGMLAICGKAVPILYLDSDAAFESLFHFADAHCLGDMTICMPYEKRALLPVIRKMLPLSRGMLDLRGCVLPELVELVGNIYESDATMVLLSGPVEGDFLRKLQKRFIQAWVEGDESPAAALAAGACGVICQDMNGLYDLYAMFPARSSFRPTPLYAHKAYHATGEYPENSISATVAAGKLGYDAAEIDVKLTGDGELVVHHDRNTKNLFIENVVVNETPWEELQHIRRKYFPGEGMDRFDDLMTAMADYPDTPVLIEIKGVPGYYEEEELTGKIREIIARPESQKGCTCIMGIHPPYLSYVHAHMPRLPLAHCTYVQKESATDDMDENNQRIYRFALETQGANAGFNPNHSMIGENFMRLAHIRGITVFSWTWAFQMWEGSGGAITQSMLQGQDGLTSDWVHHFADMPVAARGALPSSWPAGKKLPLQAELLSRDGAWRKTEEKLESVILSGAKMDADGCLTGERGEGEILLGYRAALPDYQDICLFGPPQKIVFE
ncbi:MAG: hypothetical protein IJP04_03055, partial [Clostridia bacterium]|nr:hypothetical protein [Clostridia bacterium]